MKRFIWLLIGVMGVMIISDAYGQFPCYNKRFGRPILVPDVIYEPDATVQNDSISDNEQIEDDAEDDYTKFNVVLERVYSQNRKYYLKTINQSRFLPSHFMGETIVYNAENDSIVFRVTGYFDDNVCYDQLYLSNSGKSFCFLTADPTYSFNACNDLWFFHSDGRKHIVKLDSLIEPINNKCEALFYNNLNIRQNLNSYELDYTCSGDTDTNSRNRRKFLYKSNIDSSLIIADSYPIFIHNDTLFIISRDLEVIQIDMHNLNISRTSYLGNYDYLKSIVNISYKDYENYSYEAFYYLQDMDKLGIFLENRLGMKIDEPKQRNFEYYYLNIKGFLYKDGRFETIKITSDSIFDKSKIKELVESLTYKTDYIPDFSDRWSFSISFYFRNQNDSVALSEWKEQLLMEERIRRENADKDSIDGVYIPKDIYEAMEIIDKNIKEVNRNEILSMNECDFWELHNNNGFSIVGDWGIYDNSRIYNYFREFGVKEPEFVRYIIEAAYWFYLKDSIVSIPNLNYDKFVLNKDLLLYVEPFAKFDTNYIYLEFEKVIMDSMGTNYLFRAFEKSEYVNFSYSYRNIFSDYQKFVDKHIDKSSSHFLPYLIPSIKQNFYIMSTTSGINLDSALFLEDINSYELSSLLNEFKFLLTKSDTNNHLEVKSYFVFFNVTKGEIDSLDNIFAKLNREIRESSEWLYSSGEDDIHKSMIKDYLKNKFPVYLHVIKLYPYIKFNFKEYKEKRKKQTK